MGIYVHSHTHIQYVIFDFNYTSHLSSIFTESDKHVVGNASERGLRRGGKKPTTITGEGGIYVHSTHIYIGM